MLGPKCALALFQLIQHLQQKGGEEEGIRSEVVELVEAYDLLALV